MARSDGPGHLEWQTWTFTVHTWHKPIIVGQTYGPVVRMHNKSFNTPLRRVDGLNVYIMAWFRGHSIWQGGILAIHSNILARDRASMSERPTRW